MSLPLIVKRQFPTSNSNQSILRVEQYPPPRLTTMDRSRPHISFIPFKPTKQQNFHVVQTPQDPHFKNLKKFQKISQQQLTELESEARRNDSQLPRIMVNRGVMASESSVEDDITDIPYNPQSILVHLECGKRTLTLNDTSCKYGRRDINIEYAMSKPPQPMGITPQHVNYISRNADHIRGQMHGNMYTPSISNLKPMNFITSRFLKSPIKNQKPFNSWISKSGEEKLSPVLNRVTSSKPTVKCNPSDSPYVPQSDKFTSSNHVSYQKESNANPKLGITSLEFETIELPRTPEKSLFASTSSTPPTKRRKADAQECYFLLSPNSPIRLPE